VKAFLTGGSGFVGTALTHFLTEQGHEVTILSRTGRGGDRLAGRVAVMTGDPTKPGPWQDACGRHDVLINLAGATAFRRWTDSYKKLMVQSRILTTRHVVEAIPRDRGSQITLISTSGVGYYGFTGDEELGEDSPPGSDFFARLAQDWEAEALKAQDKGARVVVTRFGVVLGGGGGALPLMTLPFRLFFGGPLGNGRQWVSWIHQQDFCRAMLFAAEHPNIQGALNFASPYPVRNAELAAAIGKVLRRPAFMPAPAFMMKLVLGEFASVILKGQRVVPGALQRHGFTFIFPDVNKALEDLLGK